MAQLKKIRIELFLASLIVLFQELALIRWLPGQVRVLAYFPNLVLLSAFLGLGLGCLRAGKKSLLYLWPVSLLTLVVFAQLGSHIAFTQNSVSEHLWLLYYDLPPTALVINDVKIPIIIAFLLSTISFIPLGQLVSERLQMFNLKSSSLWGYCWDIAGSIVGVIGFSILGFFGVFPVYWFIGFMGVGLIFFIKKRMLTMVFLLFIAVIGTLIHYNEKAEFYSPYYSMSSVKKNNSLQVLTNGSLHQVAFDVSQKPENEEDGFSETRIGYHLPYTFIKNNPRKALVLGAGTGNDVAVMLDEGIQRIDAVEIDSVIITLGKKQHPNSPYDSNRVRVFNTDARSYLNNTDEKYDLVVFGTLDSMTRLSALSNVRLDNFVYTVECIEAAKKVLKPGGGIVLYFMVSTPYIHNRLTSLLAVAFEQTPYIVHKHYNLFNVIYMAGPAFSGVEGEKRSNYYSENQPFIMSQIDLPTDDWPFLYLKEKGISSFYLLLIGTITLLTLLLVYFFSADMRQSFKTGKGIDVQMFLFGFAFLLLETRYVTQMNLVWGATWITSSIVFGSILLMILLSAVLVQLRPLPMRYSMLGLIGSLLASYFIPITVILQQTIFTKLLLSIGLVGVPIFFAGTCFGILFKKRSRVDLAFGWNLIGAVVGGLAEFLTMIIGFKALLLLSVVIYLMAYSLYLREERNRGLPI